MIAGIGPQRGYFVNEHADGDRDFGTFEGKIVTAGGEVTIEGIWKYTGGTGNFQGLTGGGTYKGRMTSATEVENTWEGTYELGATSSGGLGNRAKSSKALAHSYEVGSGPFLSLDVLQNGSFISSSCFSVSFEGSKYFCVVASDSWPSQL